MSELNERPRKINDIFGFDVWIAVQKIFKFSAFKFHFRLSIKKKKIM